MSAASNRKGKAGERELAAKLRELFPELAADIRRISQLQASRDNTDADVTLPGYHVECKRQRRCNPRAALKQAIADADASDTPVAMTRDDGDGWIVTMRLEDFARAVRG